MSIRSARVRSTARVLAGLIVVATTILYLPGTVAASPTNQAPVLPDYTFTVDRNSSLLVRIEGRDPNPDDRPVFRSIDDEPDNGELRLADVIIPADDPHLTIYNFFYIPNSGFSGTDEAEVRVCDPGGLCDTATLTFVVNAAPTFEDATFVGQQDGEVAGSFPASDTDGDALTFSVITPPASGSLDLSAPREFTYRPDAGFHGTDEAEVRACDPRGLCDTATITFAINATPVATNTTITVDEDTDVVVTRADLDALVDDPDHADSDLTYTTTAPSHGVVAPVGTGFEYTPDPDLDGTDRFDYEACDPDGLCGTGTITIDVTAINDAPVVDRDTIDVTVVEDGTVTGDVPVTDPDNSPDELTYDISSPPEHGTATPGSFTYAPDPDFHGTDTFAVTVCDPDGACDTSTINVTVLPVNDAPTGTDDALTAKVGDTVTLESTITDVDGDELTHTWSQSSGPPVRLSGSDQPAAMFEASTTGTHTFVVTACDPDRACTTATMTVDVTEPAILPFTGGVPTKVALTGLALLLGGLALALRNRPRHLDTV